MREQSGLHLAVIEVTKRCNLMCSHCYHKFDSSKRLNDITDMSWDDISLIIKELEVAGCSYVTISGGEPLLAAPKTFSLARQLQLKGIKTTLTTNGLLLYQFKLDDLRYFNHIQISLDGPRQVHNAIRGKETFERTLHQIYRFRDGGLSVSIMMTLSSTNYAYLPDIASLCYREKVKISVERMTPVGRGATMSSLNKNQWKKVVEYILQRGIECTDPICRLVRQIQSDKKPLGISGCTAGIAALVITPQMDVLPCVRIRRTVGNLKKHKLIDIWERSNVFNMLRERNSFNGKCGKCKYLWQCGGCRADALAIHDNIYGNDPLCWL